MSKDLFSNQSDIYARYRPGYPPELIDYILQFVAGRDTAWDCATGNGQAALLLASHFSLVQATDISGKQIANSKKHPRIQYAIAKEESTPFAEQSFDLITVAQAYHWFNFKGFKQEAKRLLKPTGVVAVWGYSMVSSEYDKLNEMIAIFYNDTVGPFWDAERKYVDDHYRTIPFPYEEFPAKEFFMEVQWNLEDLSGYLNTWSSVQHFIKAKGYNPVDELRSDLQMAWPLTESIVFRFPLFLRLGRIRK
ncbi:MAG: class I SAM-dependent methyltransferase [Chitinophagaceae bacterium]|nr:class I SAM-dependent methyltransferase [Chitinophagaceae bacterium]